MVVEFIETGDGMLVVYEYPTGRAMLYPKERFEAMFGTERDLDVLKQMAAESHVWTAIFAEVEAAAVASQ